MCQWLGRRFRGQRQWHNSARRPLRTYVPMAHHPPACRAQTCEPAFRPWTVAADRSRSDSHPRSRAERSGGSSPLRGFHSSAYAELCGPLPSDFSKLKVPTASPVWRHLPHARDPAAPFPRHSNPKEKPGAIARPGESWKCIESGLMHGNFRARPFSAQLIDWRRTSREPQ
jgi:hypothetical protein